MSLPPNPRSHSGAIIGLLYFFGLGLLKVVILVTLQNLGDRGVFCDSIQMVTSSGLADGACFYSNLVSNNLGFYPLNSAQIQPVLLLG